MKVVIVGGGLVGALNAVFFAKRGEDVEVFELREGRLLFVATLTSTRADLRRAPTQRGRSINLALSVRGLAALEAVGLKEAVQPLILPMSGRMLHKTDGALERVPYGVFGEASRVFLLP